MSNMRDIVLKSYPRAKCERHHGGARAIYRVTTWRIGGGRLIPVPVVIGSGKTEEAAWSDAADGLGLFGEETP